MTLGTIFVVILLLTGCAGLGCYDVARVYYAHDAQHSPVAARLAAVGWCLPPR